MRQRRLIKLEAVERGPILTNEIKLGQVLADVIAYTELRAFRCDDLVEPLMLKLLLAERVVALDLAAELFVLVDLRELEDFIAETTGDAEAVDDLLHDSAGAANTNVLVAARAILVELQPVFDAALTEELVAVVTLLGLAGDFEANLAEYESSEVFANLVAGDALWIVADAS